MIRGLDGSPGISYWIGALELPYLGVNNDSLLWVSRYQKYSAHEEIKNTSPRKACKTLMLMYINTNRISEWTTFEVGRDSLLGGV